MLGEEREMVDLPNPKVGAPRERTLAPNETVIPVLDGLRGTAVLIVLASHLSNYGFLPQPGLQGTGKAGVYLFFVLSAFLLIHRLLGQLDGDHPRGRVWIEYVWRRVLRIAPLYLLVLLLSAGLTAAGVSAWHYQLDAPSLLRHLRLQEGQSVLWSIPVELKFYAVIPVFAVLLAACVRRPWATALGVVLVGGAILVSAWTWPAATAQVNDVRLAPYLPVFLCGVLAAWLYRQRWAARRPGVWGVGALVAIAALMGSIPSVAAWATSSPLDPALAHRWFLFHGIAWSALLLATLHGPLWLQALFGWSPLRWAGRVSFSAYLWHMPVVDAVRELGLPPAMGLLAVLTGTAAVSAVSYLLVERPLQAVRLPVRTPREARA